jgi:hypothetical protein
MSKLQKNLASINAKMRLLVPKKVSEDDKLIEYDALLLDRFLGILHGLHGDDVRETVIIIISSIILAISSQKLYANTQSRCYFLSLAFLEIIFRQECCSRSSSAWSCPSSSLSIYYYCLSVFRVTGGRSLPF